ncbi:MAG: iron-siderophore ABC transporter substrate-binding protein [Anaerolineae bacterium]|nr:MAG: putative ABC transporter substrate binding protein [Chloroflexi bacterium OLB13]MBW7879133.1 iron-siderophore ABC transporter substrate-binding protein [Anaerolineae bacterium]MEB2364584.1 iron-siderophore ABC transporter substrate-binding protein [Chloroflexota bacterium]
MSYRNLLIVVLALLLGLIPAAAQETSDGTFPVTVEHKFGSTTITQAPERVLSLGYTDQDPLFALGITPVAVRYWYSDTPYAIFPWAVEAAGDATPDVLTMDFGALNYEAILALSPDLIIAVSAGITQDEYDLLSQIAPTIAQSGDYIDFGMPWQEATQLIGDAVGKSAEAAALVADVEAQFADARARIAGLAGKTVASVYYYNGTFGFYTAQDVRGRFFTDLGLVMPEELLAAAGDQFFANLSAERIDLIDQDVVAVVNMQFVEGGREGLESQPLFSQLEAVKDGRVLYFEPAVEDALGFSSVLSLPYALENVLPQLEALAGAASAAACEAGLRPIANVCVPEDPQRIVTVTDSDLDALLALGITPVGITNGRGQQEPPRYLADLITDDMAVVGNFFTPNLELVLQLDPDVILAAGLSDPAVLEQLNAIAPTVDTYVNGRDWKAHFLTVADAVNQTDAADAFLAEYEARIAELQTTLADHLDDQFIVARWAAEGPQVMAPMTFVSAVIFDLGLTSPEHIPDLQAGHPHSAPLSLESLGVIDVDWAFVGTLQAEGDAVTALDEALKNPLFQALEVVKNGHLIVVDGSLWTSSGGPVAVMKVLDDVEAALTGAN